MNVGGCDDEVETPLRQLSRGYVPSYSSRISSPPLYQLISRAFGFAIMFTMTTRLIHCLHKSSKIPLQCIENASFTRITTYINASIVQDPLHSS